MLLLAVVLFSGCGPKGEDGDTYMALDWVYSPLFIDFPMLPDVVVSETYYFHPDGTYYGAYIAWDGTYWVFDYSIEADEGEWGFLDLPGQDGADRFYTLYLYSWGPELYSLDLGKSADGEPLEKACAATAERDTSETRSVGSAPAAPDLSVYDLGDPKEYFFESSGFGYRLRVTGRSYAPR